MGRLTFGRESRQELLRLGHAFGPLSDDGSDLRLVTTDDLVRLEVGLQSSTPLEHRRMQNFGLTVGQSSEPLPPFFTLAPFASDLVEARTMSFLASRISDLTSPSSAFHQRRRELIDRELSEPLSFTCRLQRGVQSRDVVFQLQHMLGQLGLFNPRGCQRTLSRCDVVIGARDRDQCGIELLLTFDDLVFGYHRNGGQLGMKYFLRDQLSMIDIVGLRWLWGRHIASRRCGHQDGTIGSMLSAIRIAQDHRDDDDRQRDQHEPRNGERGRSIHRHSNPH